MGRAQAAALVCAFAAAVLAPAASSANPSPAVGVTEDATKYADDGGASLYAAMGSAGLTENQMTVYWNPAQPAFIQERAFLDRALPAAKAAGVSVSFAVYPSDPRAFAVDTDARISIFAAYVGLVALRYPQVRTFTILNEPNEAFFQAPQAIAPSIAMRVLAASYDVLKAIDPGITVVGLGLSPEGNDVTSSSPVRFLAALGRAYRDSGRARPLMDELAVHLYPGDAAAQDESTHFAWPQIGPADLDRLKQAVWDAFAGTAQPVVPDGGLGGGLRLRIGEVGWQASFPASSAGAYTGKENVGTTTEARQARIYAGLVRTLGCDPAVSRLMFFHLIDQADLTGFQTGLLRADQTARPALSAVAGAVGGVCTAAHAWTHASRVVGALATFDTADPAVMLRVGEGAVATVMLLRTGRPLTADQVARAFAGHLDAGISVAAAASQALQPARAARVALELPAPGTYVLAVRVAAASAPSRASFFAGPLLGA